MQSILVDTGPLVALFKRREREHYRVTAFLQKTPCRLLTTWPVLTEAWHLAGPTAKLRLLRWIDLGGAAVIDLGADALTRMRPWLEKYHDRPMDLADASLLLAEKTRVTDVLTLDRADFDIYRLADDTPLHQVLA